MQNKFDKIIGKTITRAVIVEGRSPKSQVLLYFSDGSYYELYSIYGRIEGLGCLQQADPRLSKASRTTQASRDEQTQS